MKVVSPAGGVFELLTECRLYTANFPSMTPAQTIRNQNIYFEGDVSQETCENNNYVKIPCFRVLKGKLNLKS